MDYNLKRVSLCTVLLQGESQEALDAATQQVHEVIDQLLPAASIVFWRDRTRALCVSSGVAELLVR